MHNLEDLEDERSGSPSFGKRTRVLTEKGNETHTLQVMKFEKKLKELKHTIEEETWIFQELQDYSDTIILYQCKRRTESALSKFSQFIDYMYRTNSQESLTQASTERFLRDTVITKTEILLEHIQEAIARTNQLYPPTPEISDLAISQWPIETEHRVKPKFESQSKMSDSKGHVMETFNLKSPRSTANSRHSKLSAFSSLSSSILLQQRAKTEAARAKLKFAKQEANLQRELFVLAAQKEAAVAEAELNAMLEDEEESTSEDLSEIHQERTMSYVNEQNPAVRTSELTPSQRTPALPQPNHLGSLEPQQGQVNQMEPLPGQFTLTEPTSGHVNISASSPSCQELQHLDLLTNLLRARMKTMGRPAS